MFRILRKQRRENRATAERAGRKRGEQKDKEQGGCQASQRVRTEKVRKNRSSSEEGEKTKARFVKAAF